VSRAAFGYSLPIGVRQVGGSNREEREVVLTNDQVGRTDAPIHSEWSMKMPPYNVEQRLKTNIQRSEDVLYLTIATWEICLANCRELPCHDWRSKSPCIGFRNFGNRVYLDSSPNVMFGRISRAANSPPVSRESFGLSAVPRVDSAPNATATESVGKAQEPSRGRLLRLQIVLSAAMVFFCGFAWRIIEGQETLRQVGAAQSRSLVKLVASIAKNDKELNGLTASVNGIGAALTQSTEKLKRFTDQLEQHDGELENLFSRLRTVEIATWKHQQAQQQAVERHLPAVVAPLPSLSQVPSRALAHIHHFDLSIRRPPNSVVHRNSDGEPDYWLVLKITQGVVRMESVEPYDTNGLGVKVHDIEDGKDYLVTDSGDWLEPID